MTNLFDHLDPDFKPPKDGAEKPNLFAHLEPKTTAGGLLRTAAASGIDNVGSLMQGGGEILAKLANSATGTQDYRATNPLKFATDYIKDGMSEGDKLAAQDSFKGDVLKPETWELPKTLGGYGHAVAQGLGSVGPTILTALAARGRPMPAMAAQGGLMTGGAAAGDVRENFDKLDTDEKLSAASPAFAKLVAGGMSPADARAKVTNESAQYSGVLSGLAGAGGGAFNARLLEDLIAKKGIPALLGKSLAERGIARTATGAAVGAAGEGLQEGLEKVGQNAGENLGLGKSIGDDVTRDTFGDVVGGALVGKITGGVGGALAKPGNIAVAPDGAVINADAGPISRAAATAINTGAAQQKADQKTAETVAQQDQQQQADAQKQQDEAAKAMTGKASFDDPTKWWEALNGAGQTTLVQKLDGEERQTALELMATARDPRTSDAIRAKAAGMLYGIAQNIGLPGTVAPVSPLALPAPKKNDNQIGRENIEAWSKSSQALTLSDAQELQARAVADGRDDMVVVPHSSGQGYTIVPQSWVGTTDTAKEAGALQGKGSGQLPGPNTSRPGTMVAGKNGVRQQTYGDLDTTANRAVAETSATLGKSTPRPQDQQTRKAQVIRNADPTSDVSTKVNPGAMEGEYIRGRQTAEQYFPFKNAQQAEARAMTATKEFGEEYGVEPHPSVKGAFAVVPASRATKLQSNVNLQNDVTAAKSSAPLSLSAPTTTNAVQPQLHPVTPPQPAARQGVQSKSVPPLYPVAPQPNVPAVGNQLFRESPISQGLSPQIGETQQIAKTLLAGPVDEAANDAATSPNNDRPEPTLAQAEAGNYKKGHVTIGGLGISIENPSGSTRSGVSADGKAWNTTMRDHYGYIKRTTGADKDQVDVFVKGGTAPDHSGDVYVIDQVDPKTGSFDEHKAMIGFKNQMAAAAAYRAHYDKGWKGMGPITPMPMGQFKSWVKSPEAAKPLALESKPETVSSQTEGNSQQGERSPLQKEAAQSDALVGKRVKIGEIQTTSGRDPRSGRTGTVVKTHFDGVYVKLDKTPREKSEKVELITRLNGVDRVSVIDTAPPVAEVPKVSKAELAKVQREAEVATFNDLSASPAMIGKTIPEIGAEIRARVPAASPDKVLKLATAIHKAVSANAVEMEKAKHRDPAVLQAAIAANVGEADAPNFGVGFMHALAGKTKSTLSGENLADMLTGYAEAKKWIQTPEGEGYYEGKPVSKLKNTGIDLRRFWEQMRDGMKDGETDVQKGWAQIEKATNRASMFEPLLPDNITPGMRLYVEKARSMVMPFKKWLEDKNRFYGRMAYNGRKYAPKEKESNIELMLSGKRYPGELDEASRSKFETDESYRMRWLQDKANEYLKVANGFVSFLEGKGSVAEAAKEFSERYVVLRDGKDGTHPYDWALNKAGSSIRSNLADGTDMELMSLAAHANFVELLTERETTIALPTRATPLTPPKLDRVTRDQLPDRRKGRSVTPQEFKEKFGFADVGFGKWVANKQDQDHLNYAFDAFSDLASHFGIEPKNIGFGGNLHFTVGALGAGKASAHFWASQPHPDGGQVSVINLTNTKGDGTVYHEWVHALDHFAGGEWTNRVRPYLLSLLKREMLTPALVEKRATDFLIGGWGFKGNRSLEKVTAAIQGLGYVDRVRAETTYKKNADALGKDYWGNDHELIARAGEAWAVDTMKGTNTYLVNPAWAGDGAATAAKGYRGTPYPMGEERKTFATLYNALTQATTWENGQPSVSLEAFKKALPAEFEDGQKRLAELRERPAMEAFYEKLSAEEAEKREAKSEAARQKQREEEARIQELADAKLKELEALDPPKPDTATGPLADDDLSAIFDQAAAELREETQEKPDAPIPGEASNEPANPPPAEKRTPPFVKKPATPATTAEVDPSAARLIAEAAKQGVTGINEALTGLSKLFGGGQKGRLNSFPSGFDQDTYKQAKPHFKAALNAFQQAGKTLKDLFKMLIQQFGDGVKPYAIQFAKDEGLTSQLGAKPSATTQVANWVQAQIAQGEEFTSRQLFEQADAAFAGTQAEGKYTVKDAYDAMEAGVNRYIMAHPAEFNPNASPEAAAIIIDRLSRMTKMLATQTKRTEETDAYQQFSTVPPFAYIANWVANVRSTDTMIEPSAGIGGLAVFAKNAGATLVLNELSSRRAAVLQEVFPSAQVFHENAEQLNNILPESIRPTVAVMNPPFSSSAERGVNKTTMIGAQHVEQALQRLEPGGRLVAIVGEGMTMDKPVFRAWWARIGKEYDVRAVIPVDGSGYAKYGTTFNNALLVIDKQAPSGRAIVTTPAQSYNELVGLLAEVRNERPETSVAPDKSVERDAAESARKDTIPEGERTNPAGIDPAVAPVLGPGQPDTEKLGLAGNGNGVSGNGGAKRPGGLVRKPRINDAGAGDNAGASSNSGVSNDSGSDTTGLTIEQGAAAHAELSDAIFESYQPQRLKVPGAKPHPGNLVQSAAMASVLPPPATYTPNLPKATITEGKLSIAQIEAIVYAGQAHSELLEQKVSPNDVKDFGLSADTQYRRGFFIGDGTGVGKGREISGIMLDNLRQGRKKAVWISEKQGLMGNKTGTGEGATRDFRGVGGDPSIIFNQNKTKAEDQIGDANGIIFTTYSTLRASAQPSAEEKKSTTKTVQRTRLDQLVDWLGKDFDGVIAFDEAHNAGNAIGEKGVRGVSKPSAQALAVVELQRRLPNARIVYVSATGATKVMNLSYATRLGLWGTGTPFPTVSNFVAEMDAGGLATMELVARDMKQMGAYIARSLSFDGVTYSRIEHELSPIQRDIYNRLAQAWQVTLQNFMQALEVTGVIEKGDNGKNVSRNSQALAAAKSAYWGSQQRFFNQVITSMQMPSVADQIERDLAEGNAVVLQLVNTNEASQERALAKKKEDGESTDLEDLDLTPRDQLIQMVEKSFPVNQMESYTDDNGNKRSRAVEDSQGNPVLNRNAVALRDNLLKDLVDIKVPNGPLEEILNRFGPEIVAEVTGRGQRIVRKPDADGNITAQLEKRGANAGRADADAFMADKKRILIFSDAGGTGFSFHADLDKPNQRKRKHYLIQPGWRADKAVQGFGRTHRTNQKSAPHYYLASTDIPAQKRFLSSIARRLDQLGALTKGSRDAANQGLFSEKDNLESKYAVQGVQQFFTDLQRNAVPGVNLQEFLRQTGYEDLVNPDTRLIPEDKIPGTSQFLNRMLSLELDMQNVVFDAFIKRMEDKVEVAISRGELDTGLETIRALESSITQEETLYSDAKTGAETKYVELELKLPNKMYPFPSEENQGGKIDWLRNAKSGRVWGRVKSGTETLKNGAVVTRFRMLGTGGVQFKNDNDFSKQIGSDARFVDITQDVARDLWSTETAARPQTITDKAHMITGAILPIWDRLKTPGKLRVARTQTTDGQRLLGRVIEPEAIADIRKRLNIASPASKLAPSEVLKRILQGDTGELANGWKLERARVADDLRIELKIPYGTGMAATADLKSAGLITERISWVDRYFVPVGVNGVPVLETLFKSKPLIELHSPKSGEAMGNQASGTATPFDKLLHAGIAQGKTTTDTLKAIQKASKNPFYRELAGVLLKAGVNPTLELGNPKGLKFSVKNRAAESFAAAFFPKSNKVSLFTDANAERNLLHEIMHAATFQAIRKPGMASGQLRALFSHVKRSGQLKGMYGMENMDEFIAEAFSNPKFQAALKGVSAASLSGGKIAHAFDWFVSIVRSILGLPKGTESALSQVIDIGSALIDQQRNMLSANSTQTGVMGNVQQSDNFAKWFGDSKVVDADGKPLVVYHGTTKSFDTFDSKHETKGSMHPTATAGFFFADNGGVASYFAGQQTDDSTWPPKSGYKNGANVVPTYLSIKNPRTITAKDFMQRFVTRRFYKDSGETFKSWAREGGHDGVLIKGDAALAEAMGGEEYGADVWVAFEPNQIKSATGNNGNYSPDDDSIMGNVAEDRGMQDKIRERANDLLSTKQTFNWWNNTVGTQYAKAEKDADFKRVFDATQHYIGDVSKIANAAADQAPSLLPKTDSVRDVFKKDVSTADRKAIAKPIYRGTLTDQRVYTDQDLRDQFALTDAQIGLYKEHRAAINQSLDDLFKTDVLRYVGKDAKAVRDAVMSAPNANAAAGIIAAQLKQISGLTSAHLMAINSATDDEAKALAMDALTPKQRTAFNDIETINAKAARVEQLKSEGYAPLMRFGRYAVYSTDGNGETIAFTLHENERGATKQARLMRESYPDATVVQSVMSEDAHKLYAGMEPETLELFAEMSGAEQTPAFQDYLKMTKSNRSAMKRLIERKGIAGFDEDPVRGLAAFITSNARAGSKNLHFGDMLDAAGQIPRDKGDVVDQAVKLIKYVQDPQQEAQAIRGLLFVNYIGGSVASALVNLTQPLTMTFPYLSQFGTALAAKEMTAAMRTALGKKITDPELAAALKRAEADGVVSPQEIHQLEAEASQRFGANQYVRKGMYLWGSMFGLAEQYNRRVTFIAAYNVAKANKEADPFAFAEKTVQETQGIYNKGNRPNWARGAVGATIFTFKQFSISYLEFLTRLPNKEKAIALGILLLTAGIQGLPGADDLDDIIDTLGQHLGHDTNSKAWKTRALTAAIGREGAEFVMRGGSAVPGFPLDVAGRMGMGNLIPGTGSLLMSKADKKDEMLEVAGAAGSFVKDLLNGKFAPLAIRNVQKAADMYSTGMYRDEKGRKVIDTDGFDALIKFIGFQPAEVALDSRQASMVQQSVALAKAVKSEIAQKWAESIMENDPAKATAAAAKLHEWNAKNPNSPIGVTSQQITQRVKEMMIDREDRLLKRAPKEMRAAMSDLYQ